MLTTLNEQEVTEKLKLLEADPSMQTNDTYSPAAGEFNGSRMPFVDRHLLYLRKHKNVDPDQYISNLAMMIKKR